MGSGEKASTRPLCHSGPRSYLAVRFQITEGRDIPTHRSLGHLPSLQGQGHRRPPHQPTNTSCGHSPAHQPKAYLLSPSPTRPPSCQLCLPQWHPQTPGMVPSPSPNIPPGTVRRRRRRLWLPSPQGNTPGGPTVRKVLVFSHGVSPKDKSPNFLSVVGAGQVAGDQA